MLKEDWIKVEDILPKDDSVVLVYDSLQGVLVADYDDVYGFYSCEYGMLDYVTHWMPLELPKKTINEN